MNACLPRSQSEVTVDEEEYDKDERGKKVRELEPFIAHVPRKTSVLCFECDRGCAYRKGLIDAKVR